MEPLSEIKDNLRRTNRGEVAELRQQVGDPAVHRGAHRAVHRHAWSSCAWPARSPPDQLAHKVERLALEVVERDQIVHQPLGVHPAQRVAADAELTGIVRDDHRAIEKAMLADTAPERPFGGDLGRIGSDLEPVEAEGCEMGAPGWLVGEVLDLVHREPVDHRAGQSVLAHVGEGVGVDEVVLVAGAQGRQEVTTALGEAGREEGEAIVAELRRDPRCGRHAGPRCHRP